jgi:tripartite-type tricarboxylate transporter receptor subunit TctC
MAAHFIATLLLAAAAWSGVAGAQAYPVKPIRMVVPFAPGGPTDILGRMMAQKLTEGLGQQVIVENRPGAGGTIGTEAVAKSPNDGYTLLLGSNSPLAINVTLLDSLPYDPLKDFSPIIHIGTAPLVLVVHPSVAVRSVADLVRMLREKPDAYSFGSSGNGTPQHLSGELFKSLAGVKMMHVPYKGSGPLIIDLVGGQVPLAFDSIVPLLPHIKSGRLRALAQTLYVRSSLLPETPTMAEAGVPGFETYGWYGVLAPGRTPKPVVDALHGVMAKALRAPELRSRLIEMGAEPNLASTPEQFGAFIRAEIDKWGRIVRESGAKSD